MLLSLCFHASGKNPEYNLCEFYVQTYDVSIVLGNNIKFNLIVKEKNFV